MFTARNQYKTEKKKYFKEALINRLKNYYLDPPAGHFRKTVAVGMRQQGNPFKLIQFRYANFILCV